MAAFAVYTTIPEIRNTLGANVMCFAVSTVVAIILNGIMNLIIVYSKVACFALGNALWTNISIQFNHVVIQDNIDLS